MRVKTDLLAGEWAVLALLCEEPRHGYAIASLMTPDGEVGRVWSLRRPMTYRTIDALERLELIAVDSVEPGTTAPTRRILRAVPAAEARVATWLQQPEPHVRDLRSLLLLKLTLLRRRGAATTALLQAQRALLVQQERALAAKRDQPDEVDRILAQWRWAMTDAALHFVERRLVDAAGELR